MKFGHEYSTALASHGFPPEWVEKAISYKHLKKCIKNIHNELEELGLDEETLAVLSDLIEQPSSPQKDAKNEEEVPQKDTNIEQELFFSASKPSLTSIPEELTPQLRILVDRKTGTPLDARLAPATRESMRTLASHEIVVAGRLKQLGENARPTSHVESRNESGQEGAAAATESEDSQWVQVPLASAKDFFQLLEPKLLELESLRDAETQNLEEAILDLGEAVENVVQPVRDGYETRRQVSYRDLYFWREMFRIYLQTPIFYRQTERNRGAITFDEAKKNLERYDQELRTTGLLDKMRTPQAIAAAKQFLDLNVQILNIMYFQEMNSRAMTKILKKFNKRTHLKGQQFIRSLQGKHPGMLTFSKSPAFSAGNFADSIARDLHTEIGSKVLAVVPQLDDWVCPVCYGMAWRPVKLGCCRTVFCIRCIIHLQDTGMRKCPMCNAETVMQANGGNIDAETVAFLQKYFPMEVKKRQKENERAQLIRDHGEHFAKKSSCCLM